MRAGLVVAVLLVVVLAGLWAMRDRSGPAEQEAVTASQREADDRPPSASASSSPVEPTEWDENAEAEPSASLPAIPPPTAEWLKAPANPQRVSVQLSDRKQQRRVSPAGETLSTTTPDGTRVTLVFPAGSLWRSEEITIQVVAAVSDAPFASQPLAVVNISPENLVLRRAPLLQIDPGRASSFDGSRPVAGFAVRGGNELSLYPAARFEVDRAPGRYRIVMPLTRLGTYGVTIAASDEVRAVVSREPNDLAARLEQRIALAYTGDVPNVEPASQVSRWTFVTPVHAQEPRRVSLFIYELVKQLLDYYQQVVVPKFDKLPTQDCLSGATTDAIRTYLQWAKSVELLLPLQKDNDLYQYAEYRESFDKVVAQREQMLRERGYTAQQIEEINTTIEQFRDQFERLEAAIESRILPALRGQFLGIYRCCTTQRPMEYHVTAMMSILRFAELNQFVPVDADPMQKVMDCACLVGSNRTGAREQFRGTVSFEQSTKLEKTTQNSSRTSVASDSITFQQTSVLTFPRAGGMLTDSMATGTISKFNSVTDDHKTCTVHNETHLELEGRDSDTGMVSININAQQGRYSLHFNRLPLEGSGRRRQVFNVKGPSCGVFNKPQDETRPATAAIGPLVTVNTVAGEIDANEPYRLKGSHVFEERDNFYDTVRTGKLTWDIQRCKR